MIVKIAAALVVGFLLAVLFGLFVRSLAKQHAATQDELKEKSEAKEKGKRVLEGSSGNGSESS